MPPFQLQNDGQVVDTPRFTDQLGQVAPPPAGVTPAWTPGDPTVASLTPAQDGLSATIVPVAASGAYIYSFTDGVLSYSQEIDIVAPAAVAVAPGLGTVTAKS